MDNSEKLQRDTVQRRLVYDAVMSSCSHPSAEEIYTDVRSQNSKISKGTVYRNLNLLSSQEDILHIYVPGSDRYDSRADNHYHIICSKCGKVIDAPVDYSYENDSIVAEATGFQIKKHHTFFEGICPDCQ